MDDDRFTVNLPTAGHIRSFRLDGPSGIGILPGDGMPTVCFYPAPTTIMKSNHLATILASTACVMLIFSGPVARGGEDPEMTDGIRRRVLAAYQAGGVAGGLEALDREFAGYTGQKAYLCGFYSTMWKEAQTGSGRDDPLWAAAVFDWMMQRVTERGNIYAASSLSHNTYAALDNIGCYGAARKALAPMEKVMATKDLNIDPLTYPEAGPAFDFLPEVRRRNIPTHPTLRPGEHAQGWKGPLVPACFDSFLFDLAEQDMRAGEWERGLERVCWVGDWFASVGGGYSGADECGVTHRMSLAKAFGRLGLLEAADAEYAAVLADPAGARNYQGRSHLMSSLARIHIAMEMARYDPSIPGELDRIGREAAGNRYLPIGFRDEIKVARMWYEVGIGRYAEAEELAEELAASGVARLLDARYGRIRIWMNTGRLSRVEDELRATLLMQRDRGDKMAEIGIYSLYSELLLKQGRLEEAVAMRREVIRLLRGFRLKVRLPESLAILSNLLKRTGNAAGARISAEEAARLAADSRRIPSRVAHLVASTLAREVPETPPLELRNGLPLGADLQPVRAVAVPVAGMPLRGISLLANPTSREIAGSLSVGGVPASLAWDAASQTGRITIGDSSARIAGPQAIRIAPGATALFCISAEAGVPLEKPLILEWHDSAGCGQTSVWEFQVPESGVSEAVVEAGEFKYNPFFGVPLYHHYQHAERDNRRVAFRVRSSRPVRIEVYDQDDRPISVDANGNGSLLDAGDCAFRDANFDGVGELELISGEAAFRLQAYPEAIPEAAGLEVRVEALIDGKWCPVATDRIIR